MGTKLDCQIGEKEVKLMKNIHSQFQSSSDGANLHSGFTRHIKDTSHPRRLTLRRREV